MEGVQVIPCPTYVDDRGCLSVTFDRLQLPQLDHPGINRVYVITNFTRGTVRGFHRHVKNWDCFYVAKGSAKVVLADRNGKTETVVLSDRQPSVMVVSPGIWHGWMSLEDGTVFVSIASESLDKAKPDEERVKPDAFGDVWEVKGR